MYDVYGIMYDVSIFTEPPHPQGLEESFTQSIFYIYIYIYNIYIIHHKRNQKLSNETMIMNSSITHSVQRFRIGVSSKNTT